MQSQANPNFHFTQRDHFARLFPELPPLYLDDKQLQELAKSMMEGKREALKNDSQVFSNGLAIFSQFLAHDVTFESRSKFKRGPSIGQLQNDRTLNLDMDCVYGQKTQSFFYDSTDTAKLLLGKKYKEGDLHWYDLQRNAQQKAIIPDARNDENIIVSRMQVLFIQFHNRIVDRLKKKKYTGDIFEEAKRLVIWHYHWLIIYEYLYKIMDWDIFEQIKDEGCRFYTQASALPLEFSGAAFRAGHSQTRDLNRINDKIESPFLS